VCAARKRRLSAPATKPKHEALKELREYITEHTGKLAKQVESISTFRRALESFSRGEIRSVVEEVWFSQTPDSLINWELSLIVRLPFGHIFTALIASVSASFRSRAALQLEILALRQSDRSREASETDASRSAPVGLARHCVVRLEIQSLHHAGIDGHRMASQGISIVLDMEDKA